MKLRLSILALCLIGAVHQPLAAWTDQGCEQSTITLQAELLYFKASTDQTAFVSVYPIAYDVSPLSYVTENERIINDPNFRPGFRLEADWACDCTNQFQVRYLNLYNGHRKNASGFLLSTMAPGTGVANSGAPFFGTASSKVSTNYNAGDIVWGHGLFNCCDFDLNFLLGLHVASIKYKEHISISIPVEPTLRLITQQEGRWGSNFWGIGPEFGFHADYRLPWLCNLSLAADARGALLVGKNNVKFESAITGSGSLAGLRVQTFRNKPDLWGVVPGFDGRLGLNYAWNCGCLQSNLEVGYEMIWYPRAIGKVRLENGGGNTLDVYSNYSAHGPYAALAVRF